MPIICGQDIHYSHDYDGGSTLALNGVDINIKQGELFAVLGCNGSGKSTLVKHFNALLPIQKGDLTVSGMNVRDEQVIWQLRRKCGMVFQNPDNQFVSAVVNEDIAFGLENYEVASDTIPEKVEAALRIVGMDGFGERAPHTLSGGQKQRVALAGVLAVSPDIVVFDEATAMLDPVGRGEVLGIIKQLRETEHKTIVMITHYVEEAIIADTVCLMANGKILAYGTPYDILTDKELMSQAGLLPPLPVRLYYDLKNAGIELTHCPLTNEELVEELCRLH